MALNSRVLKTKPKLRAELLQNLPAAARHSHGFLLLHEALMALKQLKDGNYAKIKIFQVPVSKRY